MIRKKFSIVHATARIPDGWQKSMREWMYNYYDDEITLEYILGVDDPLYTPTKDELLLIEGNVSYTNVNKGLDGCVRAYNDAAKLATGDIIILNSDDMFPPKDWDRKLLEVLRSYFPNSDYRSEDFAMEVDAGTPGLCTLQILSKKRYEKLGYVLHPAYHSLWADNEFGEHARLEGKLIPATHIKFEHRHPIFGYPWDEVYTKENNSNFSSHGASIFAMRKANGFK